MVKKIDVYGKQAKKVYVEFSNERLAALGITPLQIAESLRNQNAMPASGSDRHAHRPRDGPRHRPVRQPGRHPQRADRRRRPCDQARRLHDDHARLRGSAAIHGSPQRPAGADARHRDDRRRQHRRARQGARDRHRQGPVRAAVRRRARARRRPADGRQRIGLGIRALADGSARDRARRLPAEPRLAHRHRGRALGADRARRRCVGDARRWAGISSASRSAR